MIMISNDNVHDHHAVYAFTQVAVTNIKAKVPGMIRIVRFSDGCPTQHKSRGPFMDVSHMESLIMVLTTSSNNY